MSSAALVSSSAAAASSSSKQMSTKTTTKKYSYRTGGAGSTVNENVTVEYHSDISQAQISRLEQKIVLLHEDLENERDIRGRIERQKADLSVQVIQLNERMEELEAGTDGQLEINRKRDAELAKLRKLLEDVHLESEETQHLLKRKHQESVVDFQDQIDILTKVKSKIEKDKCKMQQEVYDLTEQLETTAKDSAGYQKSIRQLSVTINELNIKLEELNRTIVDITSVKTRLHSENVSLSKSVSELKVKLEEITYISKNANSSSEEWRRKYELEEQRRRKVEGDLHSIEAELTSLRCSYEEECELRIEMERKLSKEASDCAQYKSRWEQECSAHVSDIEDLKRKFAAKLAEMEEHANSLLAKLTSVEKQKSKLSSEIEILILDLEKSNTNAREYKSRLEIIDRDHKTIVSKYDELVLLYETSQRDLRVRTTDLQKVSHEYDRIKEQFDNLIRENKRLGGENGDLKGTMSDLTRVKHDLEIEVRRLESEREELAHAYKEAEGNRKEDEMRLVKISGDYQTYKSEMDRRIIMKEEEIEIIRKNTSIEIETLSSKVVDAETRLKCEVTKIKKKFQQIITELEMNLDVSNKSNIELQKTVKKYSIQITELQAHYDEMQNQLQITLDQYGVAQRRLQTLTSEYEEARANLEAALRSKRNVELQYEDSQHRLADLTNINVSISGAKSKLEQEISVIAADYDEVTKELRMADERLQKVTVELKRTVEMLHEEQERVVKIDSVKKSLEVEIKSLSIRLEEVESTAVVSLKRIICKLESRVTDMENEVDEERRRHAETVKIMRKKERNVKELMIQAEEDHKNVTLLQDTLEKSYEKINMYKRQISESESMSQTNMTRVRRFQRELEAAEERAESAESNLCLIRAKHRSFVTSTHTTLPSGEQVIIRETVTEE